MDKLRFILIICVLFVFSSCDLAGGIFKAGMGLGIFLVVAIIGLILWFVMRARRK
ncbi:MAG: hypothetical protein H0V61_08035 [Chitinophagales bacterium]|jgi:hypothetical protein|nr:hypothetical protein [Chitinophagales bacterium]